MFTDLQLAAFALALAPVILASLKAGWRIGARLFG
jgi:hypothetical protein